MLPTGVVKRTIESTVGSSKWVERSIRPLVVPGSPTMVLTGAVSVADSNRRGSSDSIPEAAASATRRRD